MKIMICDNEVRARQQMNEYIFSYLGCVPDLELSLFDRPEELLHALKDGSAPDVLFLEIAMEPMDGITVAKAVRQKRKDTIIVFVSAQTQRVFETFDCEPFHFIIKPFLKEKFCYVFERVIEKYCQMHSYFIVTWKNECTRIPIASIQFLEYCHKHLIFHTTSSEYQMVATLSETLQKLVPYGFIQTHQAYAVNMNYINRFEKLDIVLTDGSRVMMSSRRRAIVLLEYARYIERDA